MAHNDAYHLLFKTIIIGDSGVGKSCVVTRFQENRFDERVDSTLGVEFGAKTLVINNHKIRLAIWDTAGQERFSSIARSYYRGSACVILVYDVARKSTFLSVIKWLNDARTYCNDHSQGVVYVLLGNKIDLDKREVAHEEGLRFCRENGITMFVEASAMSGAFIHEMFKGCATKVFERVLNKRVEVATSDDVCYSGVRAGSLGIDFINGSSSSKSPRVKIEKREESKSGCC